MKLMTAQQFIEYAEREIFSGDFDEYLGEATAEVCGEIARFGDAGPGACLRIKQAIAEHNAIIARYNKLTGSTIQPTPVPNFGHRWSEEPELAY